MKKISILIIASIIIILFAAILLIWITAGKTYIKKIDIASSGIMTAQCWTRRDSVIIEKIYKIFGSEFAGYNCNRYTVNNYKFPEQMDKKIQEILKIGGSKFFYIGFGNEIKISDSITFHATIHYYDNINHTYDNFTYENGKLSHNVFVSKYEDEE